jgi:hypothetical protein
VSSDFVTSRCGGVADAPRLSLLRAKAASEDTSASADELIEDLKGKVRRMLLYPNAS